LSIEELKEILLQVGSIRVAWLSRFLLKGQSIWAMNPTGESSYAWRKST